MQLLMLAFVLLPWIEGHRKLTQSSSYDPTKFSVQCKSEGTEGTCHFENVCLRMEDPPTILVPHAVELPALGFRAYPTGKDHAPSHAVRVQVDPQPHLDWEQLQGVVTLVSRYYPPNYGHVLGDEVWAMWQLLATWNMEARLQDVYVYTEGAWTPSLQQYEALLGKDTNRVLLGGRSVCVPTLLAGVARMGYALGMTCPADGSRRLDCRAEYLPEFKTTMASFRATALARHGLSADPFHYTGRILILEKDLSVAAHPAYIANVPELVAATGQHAYSIMWTKVSLREQMQYVSTADVLVSLPGSDLMTAVWLPTLSEIIQPCRYVEGQIDYGNEQMIWFHITHHVQIWCSSLHVTEGKLTLPVREFVTRVHAALARVWDRKHNKKLF